MPSNTTILLLLLFIFAFCLTENGVYAFGAGNIPSFAYLEGKAFRHGDIEDVLEELAKKAAGGFALGTLLGKGSKFNGLDIKRVYFGNWLRDYSQAMDIAAFKKMPQQTILNLIMVLGFMANGYATHEFEVTFERLGVYLPVEHIDNPKGYGEGEDARKYHPSLRPPVNPQELEVDMSTGMKNYIANDRGNWDTSKAHVRRVLEKCVHHGRLHRSKGLKQDEYEAYRLLGTALHTLEDFTAHSNWCELVLVQMGFRDVFLHVGDQVRIQAPNGKWVAPIVTGTFGSNDFFHSLLGEAGDHLSQASVSDLNKALSSARSASSTSRSGPGGGPSDPGDILRGLFSAIPGGAGGDMLRDMEGVERIRAAGSGGFGGGYGSRAGPGPGVAGQPVPGGGKKPEDMTPQELHAVLWQVLTFRDSVVKKISKTIEKIPGLGPLIDKLMDAISVFIFTTLEPFLKPILQTTTSGLHAVSGEVIDSHDQYEVFNDPRASDPTHSFLSKDHFNLILNEPAGRVAQVVVRNAVISVIKAWDDNSVNVNHMTEEILQAMFHPEWHNPQSKIQREMLTNMHDWVNGLGHRKNETISRLSKGPVREHKNIRLAGDGGKPASEGSFASQQGHQASQAALGYVGQIPGVGGTIQGILGGGHGGGTGRDGGAAASFFNDGPTSPGGYAPPSGPPPGHGGHSHGGYAPPSGPPPGSGASSYAPPSGPPPSFPGGGGPGSYHPAHPPTTSPYGAPPIMSASSSMSSDAPAPPAHAGYAPSYSSPPPSFPGGSPGFPGANPSGGPPSFPGASPGFPGADTGGYGGGGGYGPPGGYGAPPGPPPGHHGGPDFPSGMGFPGAQQQHHGHGHHHQGGPPGFPGAPGGW